MPEIAVTLKQGADYGAPWITIKGGTVTEVAKTVDELRQAHLMARVKQAAQEFRKDLTDVELLASYGLPGTAVEATTEPSRATLPHQQPPPDAAALPPGQAYTPMGEQKLPESIDPKCPVCQEPAPHKKGVSAKGTPYDDHFCQNNECSNYWKPVK